MAGKLNKHLRITSDEESEEIYSVEGETDDLKNEETESQIDPRWEKLKKILDNN
jgi:uncharacterized metal-binding protein YceD (DUF177 family)